MSNPSGEGSITRLQGLRKLQRRLQWHLHQRLCRQSPTVRFQERPFRLRENGPSALIYIQGFSEPETALRICRFLSSGMTFIDVGAHIGEYTVLAARVIGPEGHVLAFEPDPGNYAVLAGNAGAHHLDNVQLSPAAVAEGVGRAKFRLEPASALSRLVPVDRDQERTGFVAPTIGLDAACDQYGLQPNLVKIDVEGAEVKVLQGAPRLLQLPPKAAPAIVLECSDANYGRFGFRGGDAVHLLERHGYTVTTVTGQPVSSQDRFVQTINLWASKGTGSQ